MISLLVKSGLYNLLIGVEAGNKRALNEFAKKATVENIYEAIDVFSQYPVYISKGFIMFTPQSTPDSLLKNLEFAHSVRLDEELIYLTTKSTVFDGTPFVKDLQKLGLLKDDYDWENEYPYDWENDNVKAFANAMQFIRDVYMLELEYTQYYGRNMIILQRLATEEYCTIYDTAKSEFKNNEEIIAELTYLNQFAFIKRVVIKDLSFEDRIIKCGKENFYELISKITREQFHFDLSCNFRAKTFSNINEGNIELVKMIRAAGFDKVLIGIESFVDRDLEIYNKRVTSLDNINCINLFRRCNVALTLSFIFLNPYSSIDDLALNLNVSRNLKVLDFFTCCI